jgi:hypothetical protein
MGQNTTEKLICQEKNNSRMRGGLNSATKETATKAKFGNLIARVNHGGDQAKTLKPGEGCVYRFLKK